MQQSSNNSSTPKIIGAVALGAVMLVGAYIFFTKGSDDVKISASASKATTTSQVSNASSVTPTTAQPVASSNSTSTSQPASSASSGYKDGTYKASADYRVPHGSNSITVNLTIKDGVITKVTTSHDYSDRESGMYVDSFDSSISSATVGEKLDDVSFSRVGGASLTTDAFDNAVSQIVTEAKV